MVKIARALEQVKSNVPAMIEQAVEEFALQFSHLMGKKRKRKLGPLEVLMVFIQQVIAGNTALLHLRMFSEVAFSAQAYCKARMKLPLALFEYVLAHVSADLLQASDRACRWRGHRVWRADGTSFSMPDTPELQAHFGQHGSQAPGCGFPTAMLLVMCNAAGFIAKTISPPLHHLPRRCARTRGRRSRTSMSRWSPGTW